MSRKKIILSSLLLIAVIGGLGSLAFTKTTQSDDNVYVMTSVSAYGEIAKSIAGDRATVSSALNSTTADPHKYEPTTEVAKKYEQADLIISNGGGYDTFSTKFAKANRKAQTINLKSVLGDLHAFNEHYWFDPHSPRILAKQVTKKLIKIKPSQKAYFQKRSARLMEKIDRLDLQWRKTKTLVQGKNALVTEPVYNNALSYLKVNILNPDFAAAIENDESPTPAAIKSYQEQINDKKVDFVIYNPQVNNKAVKKLVQLANDQQIPVIEVSETQPRNETYLGWQSKILSELRKALSDDH